MKPKILFLGVFIVFGLGFTSCQSHTPSQMPPQERLTNTPTHIPSLATSTPFELATTTPKFVATLDHDEREELLSNLIQSDGDCELPCWWGISIGETKIVESIDLLSKLTNKISSNYEDPFTEGTTTVKISLRELDSFDGLIKLDLVVSDEVIIAMRVSFDLVNDRLVDNLQPQDAISLLGEPDEVKVQSYYTTPEGNFPIKIALVYDQIGVVFFYALEGELKGESIEACFDNQNSFLVGFFENDDSLGFTEIMLNSLFIPSTTSDEFIGIEDAIQMSVGQFAMLFDEGDETVCIITQRDLW